MSSFLIKYASDPNFVLGVEEKHENARVVLRKVTSSLKYILWDINFDNGAIRLNSGGQLAIAPKDGKIAQEVPLLLKFYNASDATQHWEISGNTGLILAALNERFCIDNHGGVKKEGNTIQLYPKHGGDNQQWQLVALSDLKVTLESAAGA
ncbi:MULTISPECIES: RICIN domain-containing protein [Bradyrhizobium]|uniref:RICIN domain-containing protein n=1 Tax=Bradyrhizobium TaxID=374 RepID=UPI00155EBE65|nr:MULTISPECIES: ricin-type beta-trefoil lectin domain protein [Bradyrhizobium]MDD1523623.1 hypothetical protein [Bradyrhizobium sp. WBAH30]MDD1547700.1 hypothetical protein [Bradyrhizobium sp. WBAH41]MDD1561352.1 hypothetical protein [Bradyrhizobium sp. WBAH23]MDD1568791.1 hypothetical protein [Bradyrhizobium sp. WBAH33]MDD1594752.1 hypothetical protein [Bradyrhizobium sp. WBAH42]